MMRGTKVDTVGRNWLAEKKKPETDLDDKTLEGVAWYYDHVMEVSKGHPVFTRKGDCRVPMHSNGIRIGGEVDVIVPDVSYIGDMKTGGVYDYDLQVACYAVGAMDKFNTHEYTCELLFVDKQIITTRTFTRDQAQAAVDIVVLATTASVKKPSVCNYCSWCRHNKDNKCELCTGD
ncbi:MAG: hypothetical protein RR382_02440 [Tannerellaceae bacterium]